jgi:hypothetical protein
VSNKPALGEKVFVDYGQDRRTKQWFWKRREEDESSRHGPFATRKDAERDSAAAIFGPQCEIKEGGKWDPAWDKKQ